MRSLLRPAVLLPAAVTALLAELYAPGLSRPFVSEDFLILRHLAQTGFWEGLRSHLTGPLLEVTFVTFYRPVSAALLHLELGLWGADSSGYLALHLLVHAGNTVLAACLLRRLWPGGGTVGAWAGAALFALHPHHVNTVLFVASFATLFCATFLFGSLLLFLTHLRRPAAGLLAGAGALFVLALGSYEQAAILPVLLLLADLLLPRTTSGSNRPRSSRWAVHGTAFGLLALYFVVRRAALGHPLGGYRGTVETLATIDPVERLLGGIARLAWPAASSGVPEWGGWAVALLLAAVTVAMAGLDRTALRLWVLGIGWTILSQAPFGFPRVVPANGRYWYLASFGLGVMAVAVGGLAAAVVRWRGVQPGSRGRAAAAMAVSALLVVGFLPRLVTNVELYGRAGETARRIQQQLVEVHRQGDRRVFAAGVPEFLFGPGGERVAQVFHWGLSDALEPPFVTAGPAVYELPAGPDRALLPLFDEPRPGVVLQWEEERGGFLPIGPPEAKGLAAIELDRAGRPVGPALRFRPLPRARHRLVLLTRGNPGRYPVSGTAGGTGGGRTGGSWATARLPEDVLSSMARLYDGPAYAWIEAVAPGGALLGVSRRIRLERDPHPADPG